MLELDFPEDKTSRVVGCVYGAQYAYFRGTNHQTDEVTLRSPFFPDKVTYERIDHHKETTPSLYLILGDQARRYYPHLPPDYDLNNRDLLKWVLADIILHYYKDREEEIPDYFIVDFHVSDQLIIRLCLPENQD